MPPDTFRARTLQTLRENLRQYERSHRSPGCSKQIVPTGIAALDNLLPDGGFGRGTLVEWLLSGEGNGGGTLAFLAAAKMLASLQGALLIVDREGEFHPPAAGRLGIDLERTVIVRPPTERDALWALEQCLRCPGVAVTIGRVGRLDDRSFRRLQLAAESGQGLGLLQRPAGFRKRPSWADLRFLVQAISSGNDGARDRAPPLSSSGRRLRIELLSSRSGWNGGAVKLEIDDETADVHSISRVAPAADSRRSAGA